METDITIKLLERNNLNQLLFKVTTSENNFRVIIIKEKVTNISKRITFKEWLDINCSKAPYFVEVSKDEYKEIEEAVINWLNFT